MKRLIAIAVVLCCLAVPTVGSSFSMPEAVWPHSCRKPYKPLKFTSQMELDSFNDDVAAYKRCIQDYVQDQQDAIEQHQKAADDAVDEWNRYVRSELN